MSVLLRFRGERTRCRAFCGVSLLMLAAVLMLTGIGYSGAAGPYQVVEFGSLPQGTSFVIRGFNDAGQLVGGSISFGVGHRGFLLTATRLEQIAGLPGTDHSTAFAINERGDVAGTSGSPSGARAVVWRGGIIQDLGVLSGDSQSEAVAINNVGEVVGRSSSGAASRAVLWTASGAIQSLGTLPGGLYSRAFALNEPGDVVGTSGSPRGPRAVLWTRNGGMQDLNDAIPAGSGVVLVAAVAINNPGVIFAIGHDDDGSDGHDHEAPVRVLMLVP